MTYEKLNDHLDKKIADFNFKALAFIGGVLLKPLATASEPFFRKNMGERYFSTATVSIGFVFWVGVAALSWFGHTLGVKSVWTPRDLNPYVSFVFCFAYVVLASLNLGAVRKRQMQGVIWHSLSRGESVFGSENRIRDLLITIAVAVIFSLTGTFFGVFFLVSYIVSRHTAAQEQASIYARYLDDMDAQIEAQYMECALRDGKQPRITEGLYGPLPKRFKGEHRAHVARVVAGGGTARVADRGQQPAIPNSPQPPASPVSATTPAGSQQPSASSPQTTSTAPAQRQNPVQTSPAAKVASPRRQKAVQTSRSAFSVGTAQVAGSTEPQDPTAQAAPVQQPSRTFSPEILELLQAVYDPEHVEMYLRAKATTPEKVPPDDVLIARLRKMKAEEEEQAPLRAEYQIRTGKIVPEGAKVRKTEGATGTSFSLEMPPGTLVSVTDPSPTVYFDEQAGLRAEYKLKTGTDAPEGTKVCRTEKGLVWQMPIGGGKIINSPPV